MKRVVDVKDSEDPDLAVWALQKGYSPIARVLVKNYVITKTEYRSRTTALHQTARRGYPDVARDLIVVGANVNAVDAEGCTPLLKAAEYGHVNTVKLLTEHKAEVNVKNNDGETALMKAAERGHLNVVKTLIEAGADYDGSTILMKAAEYGHVNTVKLLTEYNAEIDVQNKDGETALMKAAQEGYEEVVDILIQAGADVNTESKEKGETALTLVREELTLMKLLKQYPVRMQDDSDRNVISKIKSLTEDDVARELNIVKGRGYNDLTTVIIGLLSKDSKRKRSRQRPCYISPDVFVKFNRCKDIQDKLLLNGGYDVRRLKGEKTRYVTKVPLGMQLLSVYNSCILGTRLHRV